MSNCKKFAEIMARQKGMNYTEATKKFVRGFDSKSVYVNATDIIKGHCVHCARAEALSNITNPEPYITK